MSVFMVHAASDTAFARQLGDFLESGCGVACAVADAEIASGHDLFSTAEFASSGDILVVLLSTASNPQSWLLERWQPILAQAAVFLLEECRFPPLLRRGSRFFDATTENGRFPAQRRLKRWVRGIQSGTVPSVVFSPDLEDLYRNLDDQPGTLTTNGATAWHFAREAAKDFENVCWIPAHGRTLAQIAGELGSQMKMQLEGRLEDNCSRIRDMLAQRRCLVIFDGAEIAVDTLLAPGKTSVLFTSEPVRIVPNDFSLAAARSLFSAGRFAEAYEIYSHHRTSGSLTQSAIRDLIWICDHWDCPAEANELRFLLVAPPMAEQPRLF